MKRVRDIAFFQHIKEIREFDFGVFYYFNGLVISEIKDGVVFRWSMAKKVIKAAHEIYKNDKPIAYISNRINNYYVIPTEWIKFYKNKHELDFYAVVGKTKGNAVSTFLERCFFRNSFRQFSEIEKAVDWSVSKINNRKVLPKIIVD